jgi:TrmH family RNA methyltransferase|nr:MAG: tRNA (cytosine(32)/uridine(32)-2'-O)-methyltransferase TrmJ [Pseudomonadota bacterium]
MTELPIRFVLVETSHPGNIGAVARAMKNMGLSDLVLVNPKQFPDPEATARASGADDVLARARVVATLPEAIADCGLVIATTARTREQYFRVLDAREAAARMVGEARAGAGAVAVVFGTERYGLSNEQLLSAHALLRIPANPAYESLNIAMAAQLIAYEIRMAALGEGASVAAQREAPLATPQQMEMFFRHLEEVMNEADFRDRTQSGTHLMGRIRRMFNRAELDVNEVNILRGILTAVQNRRRRAGEAR